MAQEIGVAYVSLLPSGTGFSKAVKKESDTAFGEAEKSSKGFFSSLAGGVSKLVGGVALIAGTVGGIALGGGISRALNIEDATAKLRGLGNDTQTVEAIMKDALASVKGTAFGLDAAATTAASAVAAGIKPGQELERYLRLTADAATIAGVSMSEMGDILNQVTSKGYAGMENLNRLTERGIPIMQWLQKEYGVTADELQKMVSRGEIDAATFRKVIEDNIGGAALESGNTTRGAFANLGASLSRLGEAFAGPTLGAARDFIGELIKISDGITSRVQPVVEKLQWTIDGIDFKFSDSVLNGLDRLVSGFGELKNTFSGMDGLTPVFTALAGAMAPLLATLPIIGKFLPVVSGPVGALIGLLIGMFIESEELRDAVLGLGEAFKPLGKVFQELGEKLGPALSNVFQEMGSQLAEVIPLLADSLIDAITELAPPLTDLIVSLLPLLPPLIDLLVDALPALQTALEWLVPILAATVDGLTQWFEAMMLLHNFINGVIDMDSFVEDVGQLTGPIGDVTRGFVDMTIQIANSLIWLENMWNSGLSRIQGFFGSVAQTILGIGAQIWNALPAGFQDAITRVVGVFMSLQGQVQSVMGGVRGWLMGSGMSLMQGFIDGINSMIGRVGAAINSVLDWAAGFFPHSPAKRGTFAGSGWTAVSDGGASLMEQFAGGAERFKPEISFTNMASLIGSASPALPFDGMSIGGTLEIGGDGLAQIIGGHLQSYDNGRSQTTRRGVRNL